MTLELEDVIARRFGLASVVYRPSEVDAPFVVSRVDALGGVERGLGAVCGALGLGGDGERGLGSCWRKSDLWPGLPQLKVVVFGLRRMGEEGEFAPACGTINLFGSASSLSHEIGHGIDFQFAGGDVPWSHGEVWLRALTGAPVFCEGLLGGMKRGGRVRLSDLYLASPHEMFARAFECFVVDRGGVDATEGPDCDCPRTYPQGEERKLLCDAIEREVAVVLRARAG